jgi:hypothetical protein
VTLGDRDFQGGSLRRLFCAVMPPLNNLTQLDRNSLRLLEFYIFWTVWRLVFPWLHGLQVGLEV